MPSASSFVRQVRRSNIRPLTLNWCASDEITAGPGAGLQERLGGGEREAPEPWPRSSTTPAALRRRSPRRGARAQGVRARRRWFAALRGLDRGGGVQAELFDRLVAQHVFLDLAGDGHGELAAGRDVAWGLVVGDLAVAVLA